MLDKVPFSDFFVAFIYLWPEVGDTFNQICKNFKSCSPSELSRHTHVQRKVTPHWQSEWNDLNGISCDHYEMIPSTQGPLN